MNVLEIIFKKSNNIELSEKEINYFVSKYENYLYDYQVSAFLMAVKINGFTENELFWYTNALTKTAKEVLPIDNLVDKHSTGGIGDKISIILLPFFYAFKIKCLKISGKGLGFTGGTVDKLSAIKNFSMKSSGKLSDEKKIIEEKYVRIFESANLVPGDSYTYKLRDTSGSYDSIDLIAASIMSKKLVTGAKYIFIDLKVGEGAMIKNLLDAQKLAHLMKKIAIKNNREIFILFSSMSEPLGYSIGNAIEVQEVYDFFTNKYRENNLYLLVKKIVTEIYAKYFNVSINDAENKFFELVNSNKMVNYFKNFIKNQGGETDWIEKNKTFFKQNKTYKVYAANDGFFKIKDLQSLYNIFYEIKMSRIKNDDILDLDAGIILSFKNGEQVKKNDLLLTIYSKNELSLFSKKNINNFFIISNNEVKKEKIILGEISW